MINNRQAGRRRGRGGGGGGGNGGQRPGGQGRPDNGNRIDSRARGNANQLYEKYKNLAADSQRQGDRVTTEYYLQFADHYFRVLSDQRGRFEEQQPRRQPQDFDADGSEEFGDEGEPIRAGEQTETFRPERQERQERPERQRDRRVDGEGGERPRRWNREERAAPEPTTDEVAGQHRADSIAPGENLEVRAEAVLEADAPLRNEPAPRRRGRPRRDAVATEATPTDADAEMSGVDVDRLPPALGIAAANDSDAGEEDVPKPRRRRTRAATTGDAPAN